jgi:hypothetical protein
MANKPTDGAARPGRIKQIGALAKVLHQANPKALPIVFGAAIGTLIVAVVIGLLIDQLLFLIPLGIMTAILVGMILFGQIAQRTQYKLIAGQPGAAASVLDNMRGGWTVTPAVSGNRSLDLVHRAVGRPGVLLVSEGPGTRVAPLLSAEKRRLSRAAAQVPIYDIQVGDDPGQIPIGKLQRHIMKLPRNLNKAQVGELNDRLRALPATMQMPKGPIPKGARMPKGPKPKTR